MNIEDKLKILNERVNNLTKVLERYQKEIEGIKIEIKQIQNTPQTTQETKKEEQTLQDLVQEFGKDIKQENKEEKVLQPISEQPKEETIESHTVQKTATKTPKKEQSAASIEDFIGGNLISKIGITVLIIGLGIFVKYAIDNNLISQTMRIVLAYVAGAALLGFAYFTEKKYSSYSAVLFSGAVATWYFTTFVAFDFYALFTKIATIIIMLFTSALAVGGAIRYKQQIIGVIGLVGAYAIPLLTSDHTGNVVMLFSYVAFINVMILIIAFKQNWRATQWVAFTITWLMFGGWFLISYLGNNDIQKQTALVFAIVYWAIFQAITLVYKWWQKEELDAGDVLLMLSNAFFVYTIGMAVFTDMRHQQGIFTLANAGVYGLLALAGYTQKLADRNVFYTLLALAITFLAIAVPVELRGNWIPILWMAMAVALWIIGRKQQVLFFETGALVLIAMSSLALFRLWGKVYYDSPFFYSDVPPKAISIFTNPLFFTSLFIALLLGAMTYGHMLWKPTKEAFVQNFSHIITALCLVIVSYFTFYNEIFYYFQFKASLTKDEYDYITDYYTLNLQRIWLINYTAIYLAICQFLNWKLLKSIAFKQIVTLGVAINAVMLITVFDIFSSLRYSAIVEAQTYQTATHYLTYLIHTAPILLTWWVVKKEMPQLKNITIIAVNLLIIIAISFEFTHLYVMANATQQTFYDISDEAQKLGYSILWGVYAFALIAYGIWQKRKIHRLLGMAILAITILKIFVLDLSYNSTVSKIVTFIVIGVLLLIISFLYQKFKHIILAEDETQESNN